MVQWLFRNMDDEAFNLWGRRAAVWCVGAALVALVAQIAVIVTRLLGVQLVGDTAQLALQVAWVPFLLPSMAFFGERLRRDFDTHKERMAASDARWEKLNAEADRIIANMPPEGQA